MLERLVDLGMVLVVFWTVGLLHQLGHYYTGRQIVGIPGSEMRITTPLVPRYVALQDDSEWILPRTFERYRKCYERHDPSYEHLERFVAGGEIIQTLVVVPVSLVLTLTSFDQLATVLVVSSIGVSLVYVTIDAYHTRRTGTLSGDYSALWYVSPRIPVLLLLGFLFVHLGVFYFVV